MERGSTLKLDRLITTANIKIERSPTWKMCDKIEIINTIKAKLDYLEVGPTRRLFGSYYIGGFVYPSSYDEYEFCPDFDECVSHICLVNQADFDQWQRNRLEWGSLYPPPCNRYFVSVAGLKYATGMMSEKLILRFDQGDLH